MHLFLRCRSPVAGPWQLLGNADNEWSLAPGIHQKMLAKCWSLPLLTPHAARCVLMSTLTLASDVYLPPSPPTPTATPVVILPGLYGSKQNWRSVSKSLATAAQRPVLPVDLRNHGASPHSPFMSYAAMADDVLATLASELPVGNNGAAVLIGHSMGGRVAMLAAATHPESVAQLVVVDVSPVAAPAGANTMAGYLEALAGAERLGATRRRDADTYLAAHGVSDPAIRAFLLTNLVANGDGTALRSRINIPALREFVADMWDFTLPTTAADTSVVYAGPTLFVRGGRSGYLPDAHLPALARMFPQAQVATMDGCGHWPHAERPAEFVSIVTSWVGSSSSNT
ncbi:Alpha/Beta hydrolase protein [Blastocladiella britannica]|nr:Alpha/Beta hydrolase protein [Blastocladiella britannica]